MPSRVRDGDWGATDGSMECWFAGPRTYFPITPSFHHSAFPFSSSGRSSCSPAGRSSNSRKCSGRSGSAMRCSSPSHLPRSRRRQRFEQNGPYGPSNHAPLFWQVGHLTWRGTGIAENRMTWGGFYSRFLESIQIVTGPSLTSATCMSAPNSPVATGPPKSARSRVRNDS